MKRGAMIMVGAGALWALLSLVLALGGHAPSVTLLPVPKRHYYLAQAAFVIPLLLLLWVVCTLVVRRVAGWLGGRGNSPELWARIAVALAAPIAVCVVAIDLAVYFAYGFGALGRVVRYAAPVAFVLSVALAAHAARVVHRLSVARAFVAALAGVVAQAVVGGVALR